MNQAEFTLTKLIEMEEGDKLEIVCSTEKARKNLLSILLREKINCAKVFKNQGFDKVSFSIGNTKDEKFLITIFKE